MAAAGALFVGPSGQDAPTAIRVELQALTTITTGDLLYLGQIWRARIRTRTFQGLDVNGQPFVPYSTKGPYYFYPNGSSASGKTADGRKARATAAANRHKATGKIGIRTSTGIRYESYAAAKTAHGVSVVNLYGMEQHTHMLDTMLVKAGGAEVDMVAGEFMGGGGELDAFEQNVPCYQLAIGFYGPEAARAKGQNEGNSKTPQREFFALNTEDLQLGERATGQRMMLRAASNHTGPAAPSPLPFSGGSDDWIPF